MTKAHSTLQDNGGRCEGCNLPETEHQPQTTVPVLLAGFGPGGVGPGEGTMWLCPSCVREREQRLAEDVLKARRESN